MQNEQEIIPPSIDATETEKELIQKFLEKKKTVEQLTELLKQSTKDRDDIEARIIKQLMDEGKQATARYEGLGHVCVVQGAAHASIQKGMSDAVKEHLRSIGREDLIKESIAATSLSAYVRECLQSNQEIPIGVTFYVPQFLRYFESK